MFKQILILSRYVFQALSFGVLSYLSVGTPGSFHNLQQTFFQKILVFSSSKEQHLSNQAINYSDSFLGLKGYLKNTIINFSLSTM